MWSHRLPAGDSRGEHVPFDVVEEQHFVRSYAEALCRQGKHPWIRLHEADLVGVDDVVGDALEAVVAFLLAGARAGVGQDPGPTVRSLRREPVEQGPVQGADVPPPAVRTKLGELGVVEAQTALPLGVQLVLGQAADRRLGRERKQV